MSAHPAPRRGTRRRSLDLPRAGLRGRPRHRPRHRPRRRPGHRPGHRPRGRRRHRCLVRRRDGGTARSPAIEALVRGRAGARRAAAHPLRGDDRGGRARRARRLGGDARGQPRADRAARSVPAQRPPRHGRGLRPRRARARARPGPASRGGDLDRLPLVQAVFVVLPLEHDESMASQREALARLRELGAGAPPDLADFARATLDSAEEHAAIIERFGRYPPPQRGARGARARPRRPPGSPPAPDASVSEPRQATVPGATVPCPASLATSACRGQPSRWSLTSPAACMNA